MNFSIRRVWVVLRKEITDSLRDWRSVSSSLLTPIFMPVFLIALIMVVGKSVLKESVETSLQLPVMGAEYAPGLMDYLQQNGVNVLPPPQDAHEAVRQGQMNVVLVIPDGYGEKLAKGQPATLELVMDSSRSSAAVDVQRARGLLNGYNATIAALRLQARGVNPGITRPLVVDMVDMATPESQAIIFLNMLPFLLIMTIFLGGLNVIIDTTAGERERGSLEPLLVNPAQRAEMVLGKLGAALPFGVFSVGLTLVLFGIGFNVIPLEEYVGFKMTINPGVLLTLFGICLPMVLFASALQMIVASFTRSYKEAQTYLSFLPLVAGLPGAFLAFLPVKATQEIMLIPMYGQSILINQFLRGETVPGSYLTTSILATLGIAVVLIFVAMRLYMREQILFSK